MAYSSMIIGYSLLTYSNITGGARVDNSAKIRLKQVSRKSWVLSTRLELLLGVKGTWRDRITPE